MPPLLPSTTLFRSPLSQKAEQVKVRTLEAVFATVARNHGVPRVVAGDLNTPRYESRTGEVFTFARTRSGRLRPAYGERHDQIGRAACRERGEVARRGGSR